VATYATKYELLRGYVHASTLRWSYGTVKGRGGDWAAALAAKPLALVMAGAVAAGFDGVWMDPAGFEPAQATRILSALRSVLGVRPLGSPDRDLWFLDLRPYRARLERDTARTQLALLRERTLHPLTASCAADGLILSNPSPRPVRSTLAVHLAAGGTLSQRVMLAPGTTRFKVSGTIAYATLADDALAGFARAGHGGAGSVVPGLIGPGCPG
jgi:hypothetical protein